MKSSRFNFLYILLFIVGSVNSQSIEDAKSSCKNGDHARAIEIYTKLLKSRPKDANLNLLNGICLLETKNYRASEKYLDVAAKRNLSDANFYLGEMQYLTYRFEESVENITKFIQNPKSTPILKTKAEKLLPLSQSASRLMRGVEQIQIIDSLIVNKSDFMNHYRLGPEVGAVKSYMSYFHQKSDILTSVYQNQKSDKIYFAEKTTQNGTDIFLRSRLLDGWGDKVALTGNVNTKANENFPFMLSDGVTLYYCSDGEGTMGGSDIFVTRYNLENESYLNPDNVGMPFNSIYNDYLLAIDEPNNIGWFASDRYQPTGKVVIYIFIPNSNKTLVENVSQDRLAQLAAIHSIRDTWEKGADYTPTLDKIKSMEGDSTQIPSVQSQSFRFVLDDNNVYRSLDQFRSEEAIFAFIEVLKMTDQIKEQRNKLDNLRIEFSESDTESRTKLSSVVLPMEKEIDELEVKKFEMEQKVRTLEKSVK
ncbi:MAG: tetratricopeptide repeat protein [Bacteroidales bacterium]|nr:tetratricopeptide repeat protein [Bacteroidales bacterium]